MLYLFDLLNINDFLQNSKQSIQTLKKKEKTNLTKIQQSIPNIFLQKKRSSQIETMIKKIKNNLVTYILQKIMGNSQQKKIEAQAFKIQDWQPISWEPFTNNKDPTFSSNFQVYAHKSNHHLQIQKYQLYFNSQAQYLSYLQIYYQRKKYPYLVNSIHIQLTTKKNMCSTFLSTNIYLQRIHFRLFQLIDIPFQQSLFIIHSALHGFQNMFLKTGYFDISSDMIGITKQGKIKVWFNKNFAKSFPEFNKLDHNKSESDFIYKLIQIIQECTDYQKNTQKFSEYLQKKSKKPTFHTAKTFLKQYHTSHHIFPQKYLKSLLLWLKKQSNLKQKQKQQHLSQMKTSTFSLLTNTSKIFNNLQNKNYLKKTLDHKSQSLKIKLMYKQPSKKIHSNIYYLINQNKNQQQNNNNLQQQQRYTLPINPNINHITAYTPFTKSQKKQTPHQQVITNPQYIKLPSKNAITKFPSISFSYQQDTIQSPQHPQLKPKQWFSTKTTTKSSYQPYKINQKPFQTQTHLYDCNYHQKLYQTVTDLQILDQDLSSMKY